MRRRYSILLMALLIGAFHHIALAQKKYKKNQRKEQTVAPVKTESTDTLKPVASVSVIHGPQIQFETETYDFGKIVQGDIVRYQFKFKNTGNQDLLITDVKASCGCTVTQFPKHPIKPNQEATIDVSFNSAAKIGPQNKNLTVYTNAEPSLKILYIKGEVISSNLPSYLQQPKSN